MADVLIVEDDKFLSKIYKAKLEKAGVTADFATNGREGLDKMKANTPKVVVLDLIMPQMDGFRVLEEMQKDTALKNIAVLVSSNLGQDEDIERVKKLGAKEFLVKADNSIADIVKKITSYI